MAKIEPIYMPFDEIHKAGGIVNHIKNSWWAVHPDKGLLFFPYSDKKRNIKQASPQCNSNESTARLIASKLWPEMEVRFFESVLQPIDVRDYVN